MNLKELILQNPELQLIFYNKRNIDRYYKELNVEAEIKSLTFHDDNWMDKEEYRERLWDDLCNIEEYANLSDEECEEIIDKKIMESHFEKMIVVYVE